MTYQPTRSAGPDAPVRPDADDQTRVLIWTDGARVGDPTGGPGGWAYVASLGDKRRQRSGSVAARVTNIQMEMVAVIQALRSLVRREVPTVVHTDLEMLAKGVAEWLPKWRLNGWVASNRKPVANRELWEALAELLDERAPDAQITVVWVRGHSGVPENEAADGLAERAARCAATDPTSSTTPSRFDKTTGLMVRAA